MIEDYLAAPVDTRWKLYESQGNMRAVYDFFDSKKAESYCLLQEEHSLPVDTDLLVYKFWKHRIGGFVLSQPFHLRFSRLDKHNLEYVDKQGLCHVTRLHNKLVFFKKPDTMTRDLAQAILDSM